MKNLPLQGLKRKPMKKLFCFFFLGCFGIFVSSLAAQTIEELSLQALNAEKQEDRLAAANQLTRNLIDSLSNPSFTLSSTKYQNLSIQNSDDGLIRIFTWCVPINQGFYNYFGIIQTFFDTPQIISLHDDDIDDENQEFFVLDKNHWCGTIYSKIITTSYKKQTFYTLLGWDGNNALSDIKIIDVLWFNDSGEPVFGKNIFENCQRCKRIFFEYKENSNCSLRYEKQSGERKGKKISGKMIVFERLKPLDSYFDGIKSMYVPSDIFDAYYWKKGMWLFLENIDARNY